MPRFLVYSLLFFVGSLSSSRADNGWEGRILTFTEENDASVGTDRHYTQGAKVAYWSRDDALPAFLHTFSKSLPAIGLNVQAQKLGFVLGQDIYTPEDLQISSLITNDRPYAGWLFGAVNLQRRGEVSKTWSAVENFRLDLGVVGPESLAKEGQEAAHNFKPRGWSHQLKTEVAFDLRYDRRYLYRIGDPQGWAVNVIPSAVGSGGTLATFLGLGSILRFGYRIPNEFEAPQHETPFHYGAYLFTGGEGRYVIRNIFLDGNTFTSSPHIGKKPWVADLRVGLTIVLKSVEVTLAQTLRTREFRGQKENDSFGTAMVAVKF